MRRLARFAPIALSAVLFTGCATVHSEAQRPLPSAGGDARAEIAQLEASIAARRSVLGLPPRSREAWADVVATSEEGHRDLAEKTAPAMVEGRPARLGSAAPAQTMPMSGGQGSAAMRGRPGAPPSAPPGEPPAALPGALRPTPTSGPRVAEIAAGASPSSPSAAGVDDAGESPSGGAPVPSGQARPPKRAARPVEMERPRSDEPLASEGVYRRSPRSERCRQVVQAADQICEAAERICRLAGDLHERAAEESCRSARLDCSDARDAAAPCL